MVDERMPLPGVAILPDSELDASLLEENILSLGYEQCRVITPNTDIFSEIDQLDPDLVIIDASYVSSKSGLQKTSQLFERYRLPFIWALVNPSPNTVKRIRSFPGYGYLYSPIGIQTLELTLDSAFNLHRQTSFIEKAKKQWEKTIDTIPQHVIVTDFDHNIIRVNQSFAEHIGQPYSELIGAKCYQKIHKTSAPPDNCPLHQIRAGSTPHPPDQLYQEKNDTYLLQHHPFNESSTGVQGVIHTIRNISAEKVVEEKLKADKTFLQGIIDGITDELMVIGPDCRALLMNKAAKANGHNPPGHTFAHCYEVNHGQLTSCSEASQCCPLAEVIKRNKPIIVNHHHVRPDGSTYPVEVHAAPLFTDRGEFAGVVTVARDVSQRQQIEKENQKLQHQLFQKEKGALISQLSTGIAHRFNNLLMGVIGNAELMNMDRGNWQAFDGYLRDIRYAADKMAELTPKMLMYAKRDFSHPTKNSINDIILYILEIGLTTKPDNIVIHKELNRELWPVYGDHKQLTHLLLAVMTNGIEAMHDSGGTLSIRTSNVSMEHSWRCHRGDRHESGDYVTIQISDTGPGIESTSMNKIFDPFYSTKFLGRGMDLAVADSVALSHQGGICVDSSPGNGAHFTIHLKRFVEGKKALPSSKADCTEGNLGKILIIDDEKEYLQTLELMLKNNAREIRTISEGEEALEVVGANPEYFDLIVLDIRLKGISGREIYRRLKQMDCSAKILIATGFDRETALQGLSLAQGDDLIQKPFTINPFIAKLRSLGKESSSM